MKKSFKLLAVMSAIITIFLTNANFNYVSASENEYYYLGGYTCGFNLKTRGATVIGVADVITENGVISPAKSAGLEIGDIILKMNGTEIDSATDLTEILNSYDNGGIITEYKRNGEKKLCDVFPEKDVGGNYRIGIFLREDLSGLGTITYFDKNGNFGALGHPVANQKGEIYEIKKGDVYNCSVIGVNKASRGKPGELKGMFIGEEPIGEIYRNENVGMFGKIKEFNQNNYKKIKIGNARVGKAKIASTINANDVELYDIEIVKADYKKGNTKNYLIKICDKSLLEKTGGILQGMSGSPIIQNGNLVGAVTHVFLNDSTRGYGISIDNMISNPLRLVA